MLFDEKYAEIKYKINNIFMLQIKYKLRVFFLQLWPMVFEVGDTYTCKTNGISHDFNYNEV